MSETTNSNGNGNGKFLVKINWGRLGTIISVITPIAFVIYFFVLFPYRLAALESQVKEQQQIIDNIRVSMAKLELSLAKIEANTVAIKESLERHERLLYPLK